MYRMVSVAQQERVLGPFWRSVRGRLPWLCVNLGTVMMAGFVITSFESTLSHAIVLAAFLPVIAGQGGIAGTQTLTLVVRSLVLGEIAPGSARRLLAKEVGLGLVLGVALGALIGVIAFVWKGSEYLGPGDRPGHILEPCHRRDQRRAGAPRVQSDPHRSSAVVSRGGDHFHGRDRATGLPGTGRKYDRVDYGESVRLAVRCQSSALSICCGLLIPDS